MFKKLIPVLALCFLASCASAPSVPEAESPQAPRDRVQAEGGLSMMVPDHALKTASGFAYVVLRHGTGAKPSRNDAVTVRLRVLDVDGTLADEDTAVFSMAHATPFLEEMLGLMDIGSSVRVWGESRTRVWEIELIGIDESYRAPEDVAAAPEDALALDGLEGVRWRVIEPGQGGKPETGQHLRVQMSRWKTTGEIVDSNRASRGMVVYLGEEAARFDPVLSAVLREMNAGAHVRVWIPGTMLGTEYGIVEDIWLVELLTQLDAPAELVVPDDKNVVEIKPGGAWIRFDRQGGGKKLVERDAVRVDTTCWNGGNGKLIDAAYFRDGHEIMDISPDLGIWFDIMRQAAPGDEFMVWIKASALPEHVGTDLVCRVRLFDLVLGDSPAGAPPQE